MKKITILLLVLCAGAFYGCAGKQTYTTKMTHERVSKFANIETIEASDNWLKIKITNLTDDILEVDWLKSSIDDSGILTDGHKASVAGTASIPSLILTPKREVTKELYKTDGTYFVANGWFSGWAYGEMKWPTILAIKVKSKGIEEYIILNVNIDKPIKPIYEVDNANIDPVDRRY